MALTVMQYTAKIIVKPDHFLNLTVPMKRETFGVMVARKVNHW